MKFNSGDLIELFMKISTYENNPLYGSCAIVFNKTKDDEDLVT